MCQFVVDYLCDLEHFLYKFFVVTMKKLLLVILGGLIVSSVSKNGKPKTCSVCCPGTIFSLLLHCKPPQREQTAQVSDLDGFSILCKAMEGIFS